MAVEPSPAPDDLTARARIRQAALSQFAEHGFERTTIRGIAAEAGVSSRGWSAITSVPNRRCARLSTRMCWPRYAGSATR